MEKVIVVEELPSGKAVELYCTIEETKVAECKVKIRCTDITWQQEAFTLEETRQIQQIIKEHECSIKEEAVDFYCETKYNKSWKKG